MPTYLVLIEVHFMGIKIVNCLPPSVTILKNDQAKFRIALRKYLNRHSFYSVDDVSSQNCVRFKGFTFCSKLMGIDQSPFLLVLCRLATVLVAFLTKSRDSVATLTKFSHPEAGGSIFLQNGGTDLSLTI